MSCSSRLVNKLLLRRCVSFPSVLLLSPDSPAFLGIAHTPCVRELACNGPLCLGTCRLCELCYVTYNSGQQQLLDAQFVDSPRLGWVLGWKTRQNRQKQQQEWQQKQKQ